MKPDKFLPLGTLIIAATAIIGFVYRNVWRHPNAYLFGNTGDAIKNYYTYSAQTLSETWVQSQVMNYPFGENFLYLDCIPILTWILKVMKDIFPGIADYSVGILHILILLSLLLSAVFIYLILSELKVNRWWAVAGALGIMVMSPQIFRMTGHLALSFALCIPMTWYLSIRMFKSHRPFLWCFVIACNVVLWFFTHAYLGMIAASFVALQFMVEIFLNDRSRWTLRNRWIHFGIGAFLPVLFFWVFITITDHHIGRTTNPWGFFSNNANPQTIFLPHHGILRGWLGQIVTLSNQNWNGWAYIGLPSTIMTILLITGWIRKKRGIPNGITHLWNEVTSQVILRRALWAGLILLLFSMALPFKLGLQFLLDWFPVIKKFRGTGRFAWVFYYVITVTSVYGLHYLYQNPGLSRLPRQILKGLVVVLLFAYIAEGWSYHEEVAGEYGLYPNHFSTIHLSDDYQAGLAVIERSDYQAILPLPFYHKGSENFAVEGTDRILQASMTLAYHTRLPLWGNYATHTSIPESKKSMQTLSPGYYKKAIQSDIPSDKDVLVVYSKEALNRYEQAMLDKGRRVYAGEHFELYRLPVERIFEDTSNEEIQAFEQKRLHGELHKSGDFYVSDSPNVILYEGFEDSPAAYSVAGKGAYHGQENDRKALWTIPAGLLDPDTTYILSFWFSNFGKNFGQDITNVYVQINEVLENGDRNRLKETRPASSMVINGDWSLVEMEFKPTNSNTAIEVYLRGPWRGKKDYFIDELLIRPRNVDVYQILEYQGDVITGLMKNNQRIFSSFSE